MVTDEAVKAERLRQWREEMSKVELSAADALRALAKAWERLIRSRRRARTGVVYLRKGGVRK